MNLNHGQNGQKIPMKRVATAMTLILPVGLSSGKIIQIYSVLVVTVTILFKSLLETLEMFHLNIFVSYAIEISLMESNSPII